MNLVKSRKSINRPQKSMEKMDFVITTNFDQIHPQKSMGNDQISGITPNSVK